jgi:hypothetical protein
VEALRVVRDALPQNGAHVIELAAIRMIGRSRPTIAAAVVGRLVVKKGAISGARTLRKMLLRLVW